MPPKHPSELHGGARAEPRMGAVPKTMASADAVEQGYEKLDYTDAADHFNVARVAKRRMEWDTCWGNPGCGPLDEVKEGMEDDGYAGFLNRDSDNMDRI